MDIGNMKIVDRYDNKLPFPVNDTFGELWFVLTAFSDEIDGHIDEHDEPHKVKLEKDGRFYLSAQCQDCQWAIRVVD